MGRKRKPEPVPREVVPARDRMRVNLERRMAPKLFEDLESRKGKSRGTRVRYLACLGMQAESLGFYLEGKRMDGMLMLPANQVSNAQTAGSAMKSPAPVAAPIPKKERNIANQTKTTLNLLSMGASITTR